MFSKCDLLPLSETGGTYKVGDEIFLDNDVDIDVLKSMQDGHGAWNPHIVQVFLSILNWCEVCLSIIHPFLNIEFWKFRYIRQCKKLKGSYTPMIEMK